MARSTKRPGVVVSCEHASHALPEELREIGVPPEALLSHSCWDPGAGDVAREVAGRLGVYPYLGVYSRIVADLNRSPGGPDSVPETSFGLPVVGNRNLTPEAKRDRIRRFHAPYQDAVRQACATVLAEGRRCLHLSIHSFTPVYEGESRDGEAGVLFDPHHPLEASLAPVVLEALLAGGVVARENYPYAGEADALVTILRGEFPKHEFCGIEIELSQAVLADELGIRRVTRAVASGARAALRALTATSDSGQPSRARPDR